MVPTDFSDHSKNAALFAAKLASQFNACLTLFHVFTLSPSTVYPPLYSAGHPGSSVMQDEIQKAEQQNKQRLKAFRDIIIKGQKNPCCNVVQRGGFVSESINEFAQEKEFDLIVMSTRGSGSVSDLFIATNTWEVIRSGHTAVLAIPEKLHFSPMTHFAFATDFSDVDLESIEMMLEIASSFRARVSVVHVMTRDDEPLQEQLMERFEKKIRSAFPYPDLHFHILEHDNVQQALNRFIQTRQVSVIAMVNRKYRLLKNLFHKSLTRQFAYHSEIPLMVFPQQAFHKKKQTRIQGKEFQPV